MKKYLLLSLTLTALFFASCSSQDTEEFGGTDFSFSYPTGYELRKAATTFIFEGQNGEPALTFYRYMAETPEEVTTQMKSVEQACAYKNGGKNYGGYKSYTIIKDEALEGECDLQGSLITNKKGIFILFVENDPNANDLERTLKNTFKFN